jgi:hypothetical protein
MMSDPIFDPGEPKTFIDYVGTYIKDRLRGAVVRSSGAAQLGTEPITFSADYHGHAKRFNLSLQDAANARTDPTDLNRVLDNVIATLQQR